MEGIHNEAELNKFKFPIDKELEGAEARRHLALRFLLEMYGEKLNSMQESGRKRALGAAYLWADEFISFEAGEKTDD